MLPEVNFRAGTGRGGGGGAAAAAGAAGGGGAAAGGPLKAAAKSGKGADMFANHHSCRGHDLKNAEIRQAL